MILGFRKGSKCDYINIATSMYYKYTKDGFYIANSQSFKF